MELLLNGRTGIPSKEKAFIVVIVYFSGRIVMDAIEKAFLLINAVKNELAMGTKHFRQSTMQPLSTPKEILKALSENDLLFEPILERQNDFKGYGE